MPESTMSLNSALLVNTIGMISMLTFLISSFYVIIYGGKLSIYLRRSNNILYENLGPHGKGVSILVLIWACHGTESDEDETIINYKNRIRPAIKVGIISILVFLISFIFYNGPVEL